MSGSPNIGVAIKYHRRPLCFSLFHTSRRGEGGGCISRFFVKRRIERERETGPLVAIRFGDIFQSTPREFLPREFLRDVRKRVERYVAKLEVYGITTTKARRDVHNFCSFNLGASEQVVLLFPSPSNLHQWTLRAYPPPSRLFLIFQPRGKLAGSP